MGLVDKFKSNIKTEKKKKKRYDKNDRKISFKGNNLNNKLVKVMFNRSIAETKNNKYKSSGLKLLRENKKTEIIKEKKRKKKIKKIKLKNS